MSVLAFLKSVPWIAALIGAVTAAVAVIVSVFLGKSNSKLKDALSDAEEALDVARQVGEKERENVRVAAEAEKDGRDYRERVDVALSDGDGDSGDSVSGVMSDLKSRSDRRVR